MAKQQAAAAILRPPAEEEELLTQVHLSAPGMCRRGVRVRTLMASEIHEIEQRVAARLAAKAKEDSRELTYVEVTNAVVTEAVKAMIHSYTAPVDDLQGATWTPANQLTLETQWLKLGFGRAKDQAILNRVYSHLHEVNKEDIQAILGKALPVTAD